MTVLGAISNDGRCYVNVGESTNKDTVSVYLEKLSSRVNMRGHVIVLDNHKAHYTW